MNEVNPKYDDELYKHLIQENAKYIEQVHKTWNQKLLIVGSMAAVIVADKGFDPQSPIPLQLVMLAIPVMCVMLDAHLLEKAIQARIISHFIIREFEDKGKSSPWCRTFWSIDDPNSSRNLFSYLLRFVSPTKDAPQIGELVGMRSATTSIVSIVPTVLVIFLAAWYAFPANLRTISLVLAGVFSLAYFAAAWLMWVTLRKRVNVQD